MKNVNEDNPKDQIFGGIVFPYTPLLFQDEIRGKLYIEDEDGNRIEYKPNDELYEKCK